MFCGNNWFQVFITHLWSPVTLWAITFMWVYIHVINYYIHYKHIFLFDVTTYLPLKLGNPVTLNCIFFIQSPVSIFQFFRSYCLFLICKNNYFSSRVCGFSVCLCSYSYWNIFFLFIYSFCPIWVLWLNLLFLSDVVTYDAIFYPYL